MSITKASYNKLPKNVSELQNHMTWKQTLQTEDHQRKLSLYEGIRRGQVTQVRLDEIFDRKDLRQMQMKRK